MKSLVQMFLTFISLWPPAFSLGDRSTEYQNAESFGIKENTDLFVVTTFPILHYNENSTFNDTNSSVENLEESTRLEQSELISDGDLHRDVDSATELSATEGLQTGAISTVEKPAFSYLTDWKIPSAAFGRSPSITFTNSHLNKTNKSRSVVVSTITDWKRLPRIRSNSSKACRREILMKEGTITSPGYPYSYSNLERCEWRIAVPRGPRIKIRFEDLDLEFDKDFFNISISEGENTFARSYTGKKLPSSIVIDSDRATFNFQTDQSGRGRGFYLYFEETDEEATFPQLVNPLCGDLVVDLEGTLTTPGFPLWNYSNSEDCSWVIAAPAHSVIKLKIVAFQTEKYDRLTVGMGLDATNKSSCLLRLFGTLEVPQDTIIPSNALWLEFTADESVTGSGFRIEYQVIERNICDKTQNVHVKQGVIQSKNYPGEYPINSECKWTVNGPAGSFVQIYFHDFDLQDGHDFLLIGQGPEVFVGNFTPFTGDANGTAAATLNTDRVWFHFTSDHLGGKRAYRGFNLSFFARHPPDISSASPTPSASGADRRSPALTRGLVKLYTLRPLEEYKDTTQTAERQHTNTSKKSHVFTVLLPQVTKEEAEAKLGALRNRLAHLVSLFCHQSKHCRADVRNENISIASLKDRGTAVVVRFYVSREFQRQMAAQTAKELQQFMDGKGVQLKSHLAQVKVNQSSGGEKPTGGLPVWLIVVIGAVGVFIVVFLILLVYSLAKNLTKSRSGKTSCNGSLSSRSDAAAKDAQGCDEVKVTSFIEGNETLSEAAPMTVMNNDFTTLPRDGMQANDRLSPFVNQPSSPDKVVPVKQPSDEDAGDEGTKDYPNPIVQYNDGNSELCTVHLESTFE